jgi:hypothetical protein
MLAGRPAPHTGRERHRRKQLAPNPDDEPDSSPPPDVLTPAAQADKDRFFEQNVGGMGANPKGARSFSLESSTASGEAAGRRGSLSTAHASLSLFKTARPKTRSQSSATPSESR